jgi:23S rRNA (pseudouridine1915-N3)-methyltransferase
MAFPIHILAIAKKNTAFEDEIERYLMLLRPSADVTITYIKPVAKTETANSAQIIEEGKLLQARWPQQCYPVALSEEGKLMDSMVFSSWLSGIMRTEKRLVLSIGSAFGLSAEYKKQCEVSISLSPLTLPHKLCMLVLVEQLYRACTIFNGHPYHKQG